MTTEKNIGICMDHSNAHLIEFTTAPMTTTVVASGFTRKSKEDGLIKGENLMHNKEQHQQSEYFKRLGAEIKKYTHVLLFGPTQAKNELANILRKDHLFADIQVEIRQTDKMTENQEHAFVKEFFSGRQPTRA